MNLTDALLLRIADGGAIVNAPRNGLFQRLWTAHQARLADPDLIATIAGAGGEFVADVAAGRSQNGWPFGHRVEGALNAYTRIPSCRTGAAGHWVNSVSCWVRTRMGDVPVPRDVVRRRIHCLGGNPLRLTSGGFIVTATPDLQAGTPGTDRSDHANCVAALQRAPITIAPTNRNAAKYNQHVDRPSKAHGPTSRYRCP
jgi:hypothetical protein